MKKFLFGLVAMTLATNSLAAYMVPADMRFVLNNDIPGASLAQLGVQVVDKKVHVMKAQYDVSVSTGVSSTYQLKDVDGLNVAIPDNAIIVGCIIDVLVDFIASPTGATRYQINLGSTAAAIKNTTAANGATGLVACIPTGSAATSIKTTAESTASISITAGVLTAGKLDVLLQYILSD